MMPILRIMSDLRRWPPWTCTFVENQNEAATVATAPAAWAKEGVFLVAYRWRKGENVGLQGHSRRLRSF